MTQGRRMIDRNCQKQKFRPERASKKAGIGRLNRGTKSHKDTKLLADETHTSLRGAMQALRQVWRETKKHRYNSEEASTLIVMMVSVCPICASWLLRSISQIYNEK